MTGIARGFAAVLLCAVGAGCGGLETRSVGEDWEVAQEAQARVDSGKRPRRTL